MFVFLSRIWEKLNHSTNADNSTNTKTDKYYFYLFFSSKKLFLWGRVFEFSSFWVTEFPNFKFSKYPNFQFSKWQGERDGGSQGGAMRGLRTDHVFSGPMKGPEKTFIWGDIYIYICIWTLRLLDRIGPVGRFCLKYITSNEKN